MVTLGLTIALPLLKVYVEAPDGKIVNEFPEQIEPLLTEITGTENTETAWLAEAKQLFVDVPITLYVILVVGLTLIELVVALVLQEYELAPLAVKLMLLPEQSVLLPAMVRVGVVFTDTETTALLLQVPLTPNTV